MSDHWLVERLASPWLAPLAAFVVYGSWSCWVNAASAGWWIAGVVQGSYALVSTLAVRAGVIALRRRLCGRDVLCFVIVVSLLVAIPTVLHVLAGTAEIVASIWPGVLVGAAYVAAILRAQAVAVAAPR